MGCIVNGPGAAWRTRILAMWAVRRSLINLYVSKDCGWKKASPCAEKADRRLIELIKSDRKVTSEQLVAV